MTRLLCMAIMLLVVTGCSVTAHSVDISGSPAVEKSPPRLSSQEVAAITRRVAAYVRPCYVSPPVPREARQITTTYSVRFNVDGTLSGPPELAHQDGVTEANQRYASIMAAAARGAILRCTPIDLPANLYEGGWDILDLTFSPRGLA